MGDTDIVGQTIHSHPGHAQVDLVTIYIKEHSFNRQYDRFDDKDNEHASRKKNWGGLE